MTGVRVLESYNGQLAYHPGARKNTPTLFLLQKPDKLLPDGPLGSHVDLTFPTYCTISVALWTPMRVFQDH